MPTECTEVKQQTLGLSLKVWAFHALNAVVPGGGALASAAAAASDEPGRVAAIEPTRSAEILPRLEHFLDYVCDVASYDTNWDVRDMARAIKRVKDVTKAALGTAAGAAGGAKATLERFSADFCKACAGKERG